MIALNNPESYDVWVIFHALGGRFLPSQIMDEPEALLSDVLTLESAYAAIKEKYEAAKNGN